MKKLLAFYSLIPVILLVLITGCKKDTNSNLPLLSTTAVTSIDSTKAISGGTIFSDSGYPITARGVCWSVNSSPIVSDYKTNDGSGTGSFSSSITGLTIGTRYYVRSYATNSFGTAYGQVVMFYTLGILPVIIPPVQTLDASNITNSSATLNGSLNGTVNDLLSITNVMFEYGVSDTYGNSVPAAINIPIPVTMGTDLTSSMIPVMADIIGLLPYTTYHFRVRVDTSQGTKYGDDFVFTTTN